MTKKQRRELEACYELLRESIPLALRCLYTGGVSALDQESFWNAIRILEEAAGDIDLLDYQTKTGELNQGPCGITAVKLS